MTAIASATLPTTNTRSRIWTFLRKASGVLLSLSGVAIMVAALIHLNSASLVQGGHTVLNDTPAHYRYTLTDPTDDVSIIMIYALILGGAFTLITLGADIVKPKKETKNFITGLALALAIVPFGVIASAKSINANSDARYHAEAAWTSSHYNTRATLNQYSVLGRNLLAHNLDTPLQLRDSDGILHYFIRHISAKGGDIREVNFTIARALNIKDQAIINATR